MAIPLLLKGSSCILCCHSQSRYWECTFSSYIALAEEVIFSVASMCLSVYVCDTVSVCTLQAEPLDLFLYSHGFQQAIFRFLHEYNPFNASLNMCAGGATCGHFHSRYLLFWVPPNPTREPAFNYGSGGSRQCLQSKVFKKCKRK